MSQEPRKLGLDTDDQHAGPECSGVSGFLRQRKDAILRSWETRVTSEHHQIKLTGLVLRNDVPALLDELANWLASGAAAPETSLMATRALAHVLQRLDAGLSLAQVFREYRLLREILIEEVLGAEAAEQASAGPPGEAGRVARIEELARLNAGLDVVLSQSIEQFVAERERRAAQERSRAAQGLRESEMRYRALFESMDEGFCVVEVLFEGEQPVDYRFLEINPAFDRHTGLENAAGKCVRELLPDHEQHWFETYGRIAKTGEPMRFENEARALGRFYDVYAFRVGEPEQHQVAVLFNDITERKQAEANLKRALAERKHAEETLRQANLRLAEADRRKNDFLAVLSHELRNPLAPIANSLYILDHAPPGSAQAERAKQVIRRQAAQLSNLVSDLLDVTRITRNKVRLQKGPLELNELVRRSVEDNRSLFERAGVRLDFVPASRPVPLHADSSRIAQVLGNILQNSAKFTGKGGQTRVLVAVEEGQAVVRVADDGVGMSRETLDRLFQPFSQAEQTLDRSQGGLGLGLALAKGLVELHGGSVTANSQGLGSGAEFAVRLPLDASAARGVPAPGHVARLRRRVLIIEDNADAAHSLSEALALGDHEVAVAYNGPEGMARARAFHPDVVICDVGLPGMDGYDVARAFRADEQLEGTFLVALSGYAQPEDLQRAADAGFECHLAKPPSIEKLEALLAEMPRLPTGIDAGKGTQPTV